VIDELSSCTNRKLSSGHFCSMATQACVCVCVNRCLVFVWVIPSTKDYVAKLVLDFASFGREIQSWLRKFSFLEACFCFYSCTVHIPSWVRERALESESCLVGCHQNVETNVECTHFQTVYRYLKNYYISKKCAKVIFCAPFRSGILSHIKDRYFDLEALHVIISVRQFSLFQ